MRWFIAFALIVVLFGCVNQSAVTNTTSKPPVISGLGNNTSTTAPPSSQNLTLPNDYTVALTDHVWVNYTLWVDGKVLDTNDPVLANQSGVFSPTRKYGPLDYDVIFDKRLIDGFIFGTIGMKVNETLDFDVDPERGYGPWDEKKVIIVPRYYNKSLREVVPRSYFEQQHINVTNGTGFDTKFGTIFIEDFNDENVTIFYLGLSKLNFSFTYNGVPQRVVGVTNLSATIERMLDENKTYLLPNPATGQPTRYLVISKNDDNITLDGNHPLANETLHFRITVLKVQHGNATLGSVG
jgi:FKBP-type peptidyl-prolyl cis-trans isomerase 2